MLIVLVLERKKRKKFSNSHKIESILLEKLIKKAKLKIALRIIHKRSYLTKKKIVIENSKSSEEQKNLIKFSRWGKNKNIN